MSPLSVITEALQSIPAAVRKWILLAYALAVVVVTVLAVVQVDLDYETIWAVLGILGGYLGFQSAANVPATSDGVHRADEVAPDAG